MLVDRIKELRRGILLQGTYGSGFEETRLREITPELSLHYSDILSGHYITKLKNIREFSKRAIGEIRDDEKDNSFFNAAYDFFDTGKCLKHFISSCELFCANTKKSEDVLDRYDTYIFENSYGLNRPIYKPGLLYAKIYLYNKGIIDECKVDAYYITRCYNIKYGTEEFINSPSISGISIDNEPNDINHFRGELRIAPLNLQETFSNINKDVRENSFRRMSYNTVVTCMDQLNGKDVSFIDERGDHCLVSNSEFLNKMNSTFDFVVDNPRGIF